MITVSAMENPQIKRLFVENCRAARTGRWAAQEPRMRGRVLRGHHEDEDERPTAGTLAAWWPYLLISRSCAGGIRGADGETTSPPVTVP